MKFFFLVFLFLMGSLNCYSKPLSSDLVEFNYKEPKDIVSITRDISKLLNKTIIVDKGLSAKISIMTKGKVSKDVAYEIYLSALRKLGYSLSETPYVSRVFSVKKKFYHISVTENLDDFLYSEKILVYAHKIKKTSATKYILRYLISVLGASNAFELSEGIIILAGPQSLIKKLISTIDLLDEKMEKNEAIERISIENRPSKEIYSQLKRMKIFGYKAGPHSGLVLDGGESNSLFIFGSKLFAKKVKDLILKLDKEIEKESGKQYFVRPIEFLEAKKVKSLLSSLKNSKKSKKLSAGSQEDFSDDYEISELDGHNVLLIFSTPRQYGNLNRIIKKLDKRRAQIFFEIDLLEVSEGFNFEFSPSSFLSADIVPGKATIVGGWTAEKILPVLTHNKSKEGEASASELGSKLSVLGDDLILGVMSKKELKVSGFSGLSPGGLIKLMKADTYSTLISSPFLMSGDGEEASLLISDTIPYVVTEKVQGPTSTPGKSGTIRQSRTEKESSEISIKLRGTVDHNSGITVDLDIGVQSINGFNADGLPSVSKQKVKQSVILKDTQTIFISGFKTVHYFDFIKKVPILGDIPLLGQLFRYHKKEEKNGRFLIFVTPYISWGEGDLKNLYKKRLKERVADFEVLKKKGLF